MSSWELAGAIILSIFTLYIICCLGTIAEGEWKKWREAKREAKKNEISAKVSVQK